MNALQRVCRLIQSRIPAVSYDIDEPGHATGHWFADLAMGADALTVEWRPDVGFGLSTVRDGEYGEGPDEVYATAEELVRRVVELLQSGERTAPPDDVLLRELRELMEMTQQELADVMGVGQANVSKIERRSDATLRTIRRVVEAMGGRLELVVKLPGRPDFKLAQFDETAPAKWRLTR